MNDQRARIYSLVLDPSDQLAAILIATIDTYQAIKAAEKPKDADEWFSAPCSYCTFESLGRTQKSANMGLKQHVRQIHHREYLASWK
jgi:hypothetical protein